MPNDVAPDVMPDEARGLLGQNGSRTVVTLSGRRRAAETAARQVENRFVDHLDQRMVEAHLAGLVDDDGRLRHLGRAQQA